MINSMQPGRDGSTAVPRAQAERYQLPAWLSDEDRQSLRVHLVQHFDVYVTTSKTQQQVTADLQREKTSPCSPPYVRDALPATFKQLLRALERFKYPVRTAALYDYNRCRCGVLFRWAVCEGCLLQQVATCVLE